MNLFIMYMAGNSISIFPIMMVGMMFLRPVKALLAVKSSKLLCFSSTVQVHFRVDTVGEEQGMKIQVLWSDLSKKVMVNSNIFMVAFVKYPACYGKQKNEVNGEDER